MRRLLVVKALALACPAKDAAGGDAGIRTYFFNTEDLRVRVYRDAAVLTGHAKWRINLNARERGRWRMVAMQLTRVQPPQQQPR